MKTIFGRLLKPLIYVAVMSPSLCVAQTTTIDYQAWSTSQCNAFGSPTTINSVVHQSTIGQPTYGSANSPITLFCTYQNSAPIGTQYKIQYNFLPNHQYTVTVNAAGITNNQVPTLNLELASFNGSSALCNGAASISTATSATNAPILTNTFLNHQFNYSIGNQGYGALAISAIPGFSDPAASQWIIIRKITITDVTPQAPTFTLSASATTRSCGSQNAVTFTVQNPTNATVSKYKFYPASNAWMYNGAAAPSVIEITPPANSITLTPVSCAGPNTMSAHAVWQNQNIATNNVATTVTTPDMMIYGPNTLLPNEAGFFDIQGVTSTPINYNWPCSFASLPQWSSSHSSQTHFYNTSGTMFNTYFYTNFNFLPPGSFGQTVTVKADVNLCGVNKQLTKDVFIRPQLVIGPFAAKANAVQTEALTMSLIPNPSNGIFKMQCNNPVQDAAITISSVAGKVIQKTKVTGTEWAFDLSDAPAGVYFIQLIYGQKSIIERIVKQ
ncbi:T9SS type A sorting domain-containing protein [Taibaiella sp. KBW10]|uniref:T9SS type A sorting domain-containing protein n=1 Tax=Taibaiella sp. KBW10 TaxID=2153357 RepID=UPI0013159F9D|nr:T9SS type A sorting domain-containing protein [Taibaiella sp. KBW10]